MLSSQPDRQLADEFLAADIAEELCESPQPPSSDGAGTNPFLAERLRRFMRMTHRLGSSRSENSPMEAGRTAHGWGRAYGGAQAKSIPILASFFRMKCAAPKSTHER